MHQSSCLSRSQSGTPHRRILLQSAFTVTELLVATAIIAILAAMLLSGMQIVRERARSTAAQSWVVQLHQAVHSYAAEDARHRFPPQNGPGDRTLTWSPAGQPAGNLNQLWARGFEVDLGGLDRQGTPPFIMTDPWRRPYAYQVDGDLLSATGAQRPLGVDGTSPPLEAWNAAGTRPWAYVWSTGPRASTDGAGWIYRRDDR